MPECQKQTAEQSGNVIRLLARAINVMLSRSASGVSLETATALGFDGSVSQIRRSISSILFSRKTYGGTSASSSKRITPKE